MALSLGGISGLGGISSLSGGTSENVASEGFQYTLEEHVDRETETVTMSGTLDALVSKIGGTRIGLEAFETKLTGGEGVADPVCTQARITRGVGGLCVLSATNVRVKRYTFWTLDFAEVSKPVKTWKQDAESEDDRPDLTAIESWELFKENGDLESYGSYKCDCKNADGEQISELEGNTLKLAKLIREKGVESYTIHAPVATCRLVYTEFPADTGTFLDKVFEALQTPEEGYSPLHDGTVEKISALKNKWLCTADRCDPNADGTYTRTIQYTGADDFNEDLYDSAQNDAT